MKRQCQNESFGEPSSRWQSKIREINRQLDTTMPCLGSQKKKTDIEVLSVTSQTSTKGH